MSAWSLAVSMTLTGRGWDVMYVEGGSLLVASEGRVSHAESKDVQEIQEALSCAAGAIFPLVSGPLISYQWGGKALR